MKTIFLGGTCNNSHWRRSLIKLLKINYFNPVVDNWTEADYQKELKVRETSDFVLYVITPLMTGVYSIAEAVDDSNKIPGKTIFCVLEKDDGESFSTAQLKSLEAVKKMISKNGGTICNSLQEIADQVNE